MLGLELRSHGDDDFVCGLVVLDYGTALEARNRSSTFSSTNAEMACTGCVVEVSGC